MVCVYVVKNTYVNIKTGINVDTEIGLLNFFTATTQISNITKFSDSTLVIT